jgi:hypothetical protein
MAGNWGGARLGAGRKPGGVNKISAAARAAAEASGEMPDAFLLRIARDETVALGVRIDAAKSVLPYLKPRLASQEVHGPDGGAIQFIISETDSQL